MGCGVHFPDIAPINVTAQLFVFGINFLTRSLSPRVRSERRDVNFRHTEHPLVVVLAHTFKKDTMLMATPSGECRGRLAERMRGDESARQAQVHGSES
jgi:hypothetical protein